MRLLSDFHRGSTARVAKIARNLITDVSLGGLYGIVGRPKPQKLYSKSYGVVATEYAVLGEIFAGRIRDNDTIVDVGCGRGRVIRWLASQGIQQQIFGIEFDSDASAYATRKLSRFSNVTIIEGDVLDHIPNSGSLFYMYNPFDEGTTDAFCRKLEERKEPEAGTVILYYNCKHVSIFQASPRWHTKLLTLRTATAAMPTKLAVISAR